MNTTISITAHIDTATSGLVEQAAGSRGMTGEQYVAEAVRRVAESDADYRAFIQVGLDAIEHGDVVPHEQVMAELDAMIAKHQERCPA